MDPCFFSRHSSESWDFCIRLASQGREKQGLHGLFWSEFFLMAPPTCEKSLKMQFNHESGKKKNSYKKRNKFDDHLTQVSHTD